MRNCKKVWNILDVHSLVKYLEESENKLRLTNKIYN